MRKIRPVLVLMLLALVVPIVLHRPTSAQEPTLIDRLNVGTFGGGAAAQSNFNPYGLNALAGTGDWLYEPLMVINSYNCQAVPWLATEAVWTDPQNLNLTIRDGVTWSDGTPFTADDVVFTFKMLQSFPAIDTEGVWGFLSDVVANGNVVTFSFLEPSGSVFNKLVGRKIVAKHLWEGVEDPVTFTNDQPIGTGPYTLASFNRSELVYTRNPNYWQAEKVMVQELVYTQSEGDANVNQLRLVDGRYDWETMFFPDVENAFVAKDPENNHYWFPPGGSVSLMMNLTKAPLDDPEFRRGIAYAFDRQSMADRAAFGYTGPASQSFLTLPNQEGLLDPSIPNQGFIPFDQTQADQILTAAGYVRDGDGARKNKDGSDLNLTFTVQQGWNDWVQAAEIVRDNLSAIGISVDVQTINPDIVTTDRKAGNFDMAFDAPGGGCDVFGNYFYPLGNSDAPTEIGTPTEWNYARWNDPQTAELIKQLRAATDLESQKPILYQLQQIMVTKVPFIPLWYGPQWFEYRTTKAVGWPNAENPYAGPSDRLLILLSLTLAPGYQPGS